MKIKMFVRNYIYKKNETSFCQKKINKLMIIIIIASAVFVNKCLCVHSRCKKKQRKIA